MKQEKGQIMRRKGAVSRRRRLGASRGSRPFICSERKSMQASPERPPTSRGQLLVSKQAIDLVCRLPASLCLPSQPGPTLQPPGHRHLRDSSRKPVPSPSHPEERNVAWQQISQALKLHRHLQGIAPTWRVDDPRPSAFRIMAKLEELERATRPMCRWDH